jgi:peptidoglycan-associated lipoprotein
MSKISIPFKLASLCLVALLAACESDKPAMAPPPTPQAMVAPTPQRIAPPVQQGPLPGSTEDFKVNVGDRVFFAYDKTDLDDRDRATLQKQATWLQKYPSVTLSIEGHCDERGTREYNLALGARRAQAVKDYLASLGVSGSRLETISYGKERPVCVESNDSCYAQNRRGVSTIKSGAVS